MKLARIKAMRPMAAAAAETTVCLNGASISEIVGAPDFADAPRDHALLNYEGLPFIENSIVGPPSRRSRERSVGSTSAAGLLLGAPAPAEAGLGPAGATTRRCPRVAAISAS